MNGSEGLTLRRSGALLLLCLWPSFAFCGQGPLRLAAGKTAQDVAPHAAVLRDPTGTLTFEQVRAEPCSLEFKPVPEGPLHYGFTWDAIWVRFELESAAPVQREWFVELNRTRFDRLDWYVVRDGKLAEHREAGNLQPIDRAGVHARVPVLSVPLAPGERVAVYLWVRTGTVVHIPLSVYDASTYAGKVDRDGMLFACCISALWGILAVALIFACYTRTPGALAYAATIPLLILLFSGLSGYWRWLELPGWRFGVTKGVSFFYELCLIPLIIYQRDFFQLRTASPRLDRCLRYSVAVCVALAALILALPYYPTRILVQFQCIVVAAVAVGAAFLILCRGNFSARFYLAGWGMFLGVLLFEFLQVWGFLPRIAAPDHPVVVGLTAAFIAFFLAMSDKVRQMDVVARRARDEMDRLRTEMMTRLEQLVAERTASLQKAKDDAERANRSKTLFLANISHEIRTPLSALVGLAQAMYKQSRQRGLPDDLTRLLEQVRSGGRYLSQVMANLLDVSAAETGRLPVHRERVALDEWSRSMHDIAEPIAVARRVSLRWHDEALRGQSMETDSIRLSHILVNLVHNAIKFTPGGRGVDVRFERSRGRFAFEVVDEGPGLPAEHGHLFEASPSIQTTSSPPEQGVGLGLYVVRENLRLLGGAIAARNNPGGGANFRAEWALDGEVTCAR